MNCEEYNDIVAADVDGMLAGSEAQTAAAHVASCSRCQATRREQQLAKSMLRERVVHQRAPEELRSRVLAAIEGESTNSAIPPTPLRSRTSRRRIIAGAIAALLAVGLYSVLSPAKPDLIAVMVSDAEAATTGRLDLAMRTSNVEELQTYYQDSGRIDFRQSVGDFSGQGFHLVGGSVEQIGSQATTRSVYDSSDGKVICWRFRIGSVDIPDIGEQVGSRRVFTVDGVTFGIVRLEGNVVCILATKMPRDAFVRHLEQTHTEVSAPTAPLL